MMLKLYKKSAKCTEYWEAWSTKKEVTVHWGELGERGETREISLDGKEAAEIIEKESRKPRSGGFAPIPAEQHSQLVVQYRVDGMGTTLDLNKRTRVEDLMNEALGWTGLGHCDGGDIGSGSMNIFCFVVDLALAVPITVRALNEGGVLEGAVIANPADDVVKIMWPKNFKGEFLPL